MSTSEAGGAERPNGALPQASAEPSHPAFAPGPFSEEEVAAVTGGPSGEPELDEVDPADIDAAGEPEAPIETLAQRSKRLSPEEVQRVVESILFLSDKPLTLDQLFGATGIKRDALRQALDSLAASRREGATGIVLYEVAGGWQLRTDPASADYVRRFLKVKPQRLTRAAVETLAIIAYRQPVTRPEVEDIRGVDSAAVIKALLDRRLIKILGKKEEVGRPILYGTTREFLEYFALKDLASLPTLREFQELSREHQDIVEKETAPKPQPQGTVAALSDPTFQQRLDESRHKSEAALDELEDAIASADQRAKAAMGALATPAAPGTPEGDDRRS